ncbi:hypothetical protein [Thermoflavimicrobium dichotomicum]|uniref:Uncharacterized protein n=1 Tax=Thermoflavimicrobium dichotomicum TaxID=46223 RepID=A0A1I3L3K7_9BACL|nr:hypothetical protein [Thermoflavimicrobium dichotomicum]SFI79320.1 hypothetical protein SAMN05421852_10225 [Thermoflavimicrobium dichotomicum]
MKPIQPIYPRDHLKKKLNSLTFWKIWPYLSPETLAFLELEQDEFYSFIPPEQIFKFIQEAIEYGKEVASKYPPYHELKELCNLLLQEGVRVRFLDKHPSSEWIRAQYHQQSSTIEVYRSSINQLQQFFHQRCKESIGVEELIALHLYHEWFHYLEEKKYGRTDLHLPKIKIKQWGPISLKRSIYRTREIAAHTFTQVSMELPWSPLLLDHLLLSLHQGLGRGQIRENFQRIRKRFEALKSIANHEPLNSDHEEKT